MTQTSSTPSDDPIDRFRRLTEGGLDPMATLPTRTSPPAPDETSRVPPKTKISALVPFGRALVGRLAFGLLTLTAVIYLTYFGLDMAEGGQFSESLVNAGGRTWTYLGQLIRGDLGLTIERGISRIPVPVLERLPVILQRSFGLLLVSLFLATGVGIPIGVWAAVRRRTKWPLIILLSSLIGVSLPSFFVAMLLQFGLLQVNQITGRSWLPLGGVGWDEHLILPALVLAFRPLAQIARVTFVTLSEVIDRDFVRTAHSKGLHPLAVLNKHILRNAAVPILTTVGLSLRFSLSSLPIVEFFFGWQGLGYTLLKSIAVREDNLTLAMVLSLGSFFILINLLLDLSYRLIDPRLRDIASIVERESRISWGNWLRNIPTSIWGWMRSKPLRRFLAPGKNLPPLSDTLQADKAEANILAAELNQGQAGIRRAWLRGTFGNFPLMLGGAMLIVLILVVSMGSALAPHSPYATQGLKFKDGEFLVPPFPPTEIHPWGTDVLGRDLMSVILTGAQQTFFLAGLVLVARLVVGFIFGAIAGWWHGSQVDRLLTSLVEIIATFPTLLLAMIMILALNIRDGFRPFVIALCFVGWGEIMQFVRGEVIRIRPQLFIEGAVAVGLRTDQIIRKHVLPNLIPALISLAALEMGAVLLLLGELGFISIFIGGGMFAELSWQAPLYHYSDVPEWGALLSNLRLYARPYPWMGLYPSLAFTFAILGMNLFGEGLRRLMERVGVRIMGMFNRYTLVAGAIAVSGFLYLKGNTGDLAVYRQQAEAFDGGRAISHVEALTNPILEGRALGSPGVDLAAEYLALTFSELGLQPAGEEFSYFQSRERAFQTVSQVPSLVLQDLAEPLVYKDDFSLYPVERDNAGTVSAKIRLVLFGDILDARRFGWHYYPVTENLDYHPDVMMILEEDLPYTRLIGRSGLLVISSDPATMQKRYTLNSYGLRWLQPAMWITEDVAAEILRQNNLDLETIYNQNDQLGPDEIYDLQLGSVVEMEIEAVAQEKVPANHVIAHLPSYVSSQFGGLDDHMIVVLAQYDCPPMELGGEIYPCANDNASGVGVMLEIIRNMRDSGYQPYKTFLFIGYSGEGLEGGEPIVAHEVAQFLEAKYGFSTSFEIDAVVELRGLGGGDGDRLQIAADGSQRLANLFEDSARRMGVPTQMTGDQLEISRIFENNDEYESGESTPRIEITWEGWAAKAHLPQDDLLNISSDNLEQAGEAISLALMILGRETQP